MTFDTDAAFQPDADPWSITASVPSRWSGSVHTLRGPSRLWWCAHQQVKMWPYWLSVSAVGLLHTNRR